MDRSLHLLYEVEYLDDRTISHRTAVRRSSPATGSIRTPFHQPYTAPSGRYDMDVRYLAAGSGRSRFALYVNGGLQGAAWEASAEDAAWRTRTIPDVRISEGDEISVEVQGHGTEYGKLDYVQLNYKGP